jgi:hypothetical protein
MLPGLNVDIVSIHFGLQVQVMKLPGFPYFVIVSIASC